MMRKFLSFLIVLLIAVFMVACDAGGDPAERENDDASSEEDDAYEEETLEIFDGLLTHFEDSGLEIDEVEVKDKEVAESIKATNGVVLNINGIEAQLFYFDDQETEEYQQASKDGEITIQVDHEEFDLQVYVHEGFGALDTEYHVDGKDIEAALDSFERE